MVVQTAWTVVTWTLLALWMALPVLNVQGTSTCPTPVEVSARLSNLVARGEAEPLNQAQQAYVSTQDGVVVVELRGADGAVLAERSLAQTASCDDLAEAAAIVLASWQARFNPGLSASAGRPPARPPLPVVVAASRRSEIKEPLAFDAGLAVMTSIVDGDAVWGAKLEGALFPFVIPVGIDLGLSLSASHDQSTTMPSIVARWSRPVLSLGPTFRLRAGAMRLDLHANAAFALLRVRGAGLAETSSDAGMQYGLAAGLRTLWLWNNGAVWLGADVLGFPGQDSLVIVNGGDVGSLPHVEAQLGLGMSLGRFR